MATLINGNGNPRIYAAQDADLIAALAGDITGIAQIGNKFAATAVDANTISVADGVIVTKEGRRIQLDAGSTDMFVIPTGTTGVTNYYIIGYKLTTQSDDSQIAETFVQLMSSSSETITEDTFREGATDVYVSLYRVQQNGVNLGTITGLLPELTNISELKSDLADIETKVFPIAISVSIGSDYGHIADAVIAAVPADKITKDTVMVVDGRIFRFDNTSRQFSNVNLNSSIPELYIGVLAPNGVAVQSTINASGASIQDISSFTYTGSVDVYL